MKTCNKPNQHDNTIKYLEKNEINTDSLNPIQDGRGGKKALSTSFFPVTSTNVRFGPKNFLTFSFNPSSTLVQNFKFPPSASTKLLNLNQDHV